MAFLQEVKSYLVTESITDPIYRGTMPATPDTAVALYQYPGEAPSRGFGVTGGVAYERPRLQVVVRGAPYDHDTPLATATSIRDALVKVQGTELSGTQYHWISPLQDPGLYKRDDKERVLIVFNCRTEKER